MEYGNEKVTTAERVPLKMAIWTSSGKKKLALQGRRLSSREGHKRGGKIHRPYSGRDNARSGRMPP